MHRIKLLLLSPVPYDGTLGVQQKGMVIKMEKTVRERTRKKRSVNKEFGLIKRLKLSKSAYLLIAPFMVFFLIFQVIPVLASIALSFTDFNMLQTPNFVGLSNYQSLFINDDVFMIAVKNTLLLAFICGPVGYIACFVFAWFINELTPGLRAVMTLIFYAPTIAGSAYVVWTYIFSGDRHGVINSILLNLHLIETPIQFLTDTDYMLMAVIIVQLWLSLGTSFLSFLAGFKTVDPTLFEAAAIDGIRNRFQELFYVTLPQMKPQLLFGAVMQISSSFTVGAVSQALTGFPSTEYATHTIMLHINDYGTIRYEMGYACAISTILLLFMLLLNKVITRLLREN